MKFFSKLLVCLCLSGMSILPIQAQSRFRPPAYPLITADPYFSIWSFQDTLYNGPTRHWTGKPQSLQGIVRVDGKAMYFLGEQIPAYNIILPMAKKSGHWKFTFSDPGSGWQQKNYAASNWQSGVGAFQDGNDVMNPWNSREVWARRTFKIKDLNRLQLQNVLLKIQHDDDAEAYINGVKAFEKAGVTGSPTMYEITDQARKALRSGENVLAVHCTNTGGLAYLDAGLAVKKQTGDRMSVAKQTSVKVTATQTTYQFEAGDVALEVTFTAPLLLDQLEVMARPANYITFKVHSLDHSSHDVQVYFSAAANLAVNTVDQDVSWQRLPSPKLDVLRIGTTNQQVLGRKGDNVRIDWGYLYLAHAREQATTSLIASSKSSVADFTEDGKLNTADDDQMPASVNAKPMVLATAFDFGSVTADAREHHAILAYDDLYSVEFFHQPLQAWWKKDGTSVVGMLEEAEHDYHKLKADCDTFDKSLARKSQDAGGQEYARLCELAYRQSVAAHKLVAGPDGTPLFFSKENFSNGSIGTVDVNYPASPLFLYYNPTLLKGMLDPIFYYSESGRWTKPFPSHDVGTYPIANGQTYGEDMPVEEAGNMLIMTTAIAAVEGKADYAQTHWQALTRWANYLKDNGLDPKNQLSTDDFAGHLAHNANLSVKAILGIAGYGKLAKMLGKDQVGDQYLSAAKEMAGKWMDMADAGDHYGLTFDRENTWSQKYNLVWDQVLDLNIFPDSINKKEISYYLTRQNKYGLPLDNRATYTKSDWITWTATLAGKKGTFEQFISPMYRAVTETNDRVPMSDWYQTTDASQVGFQARSVVGGYFMKMLEQKMK